MRALMPGVILGLLLAAPVLAGDAPADSPIAGNAVRPDWAPSIHQQMQTVMNGPDFAQREEKQRLRFRQDWLNDWFNQKESATPDNSPPGWLESASRVFAALVRHSLWLAALIILVLALHYRHKWLPLLQGRTIGRPAAAPRAADILEDMDFRAPLPDDILAAAAAYWQQGQARPALSLLYRGAVLSLQLPDNATEGENLRLVRQRHNPDIVEAFTGITRAWQAMAWAGRVPARPDSLMESYRRHFRVRTGP